MIEGSLEHALAYLDAEEGKEQVKVHACEFLQALSVLPARLYLCQGENESVVSIDVVPDGLVDKARFNITAKAVRDESTWNVVTAPLLDSAHAYGTLANTPLAEVIDYFKAVLAKAQQQQLAAARERLKNRRNAHFIEASYVTEPADRNHE